MSRFRQGNACILPCILGVTFFTLVVSANPRARQQPVDPVNTSTAANSRPPAIPCLTPHPGERSANYFLASRWSGSQGSPKALTWSFVPDGLWIPSGIGEPGGYSELFARMDFLFGGNRALWIQQFQDVFDRWEELTGVSFTRITYLGNDWDDGAPWGSAGSSTRGDIRIAMKDTGGFGGYAYFPIAGDMVLESNMNWALPSGSYRYLRNIVAHLLGHGLGILHVCPTNSSKLMEPMLTTNFDGPQHDDIRAGQRHYGDPYETDNSYEEATDLGVISPGTPITIGTVPSPSVVHGSTLSIDLNMEQDWFRFTVAEPVELTATVFPVGLYYDSSPQVDGNCTSGNYINSLAIADLIMEARSGPTGGTILATADDYPEGYSETVVDLFLPTAGEYFIRVYEGNVPMESQLYRLQLSVVAVEVPPEIIEQPVSQIVCEGEPAGFTVVASGTQPLSYQWRLDGVDMVGETAASLLIDPAAEADEGDYTCLVSNAYGSIESDPATLTVVTEAECQDGEFCNGVETCSTAGNCQAGTYPCPGQLCDEVIDECYIPPGTPTLSMAIVEVNGSDVGPSPGSSVSATPGDIVTVELFVRDWSPNGEHLRAYQTQIDSSGFSSGAAGDIYPRDWAATTDLNGLCSSGGSTGLPNPDNVFIDDEDCFTGPPYDPSGSDLGPWSNGGCISPDDCLPGTGFCADPSIDWVFGQVSSGTQAVTNSIMCDHRHIGAADVGLDGPVSVQDGSRYYLGTVILEVSSDADGTFTLCLDSTDVQPPTGSPDYSFLSDENGNPIIPVMFECATITVGTGQCPYGDVDGNGDVNLGDLLCMLDGLAGVFNCPSVIFENLDIDPCSGGNGDLNLNDLTALLDAIRGLPPCPDECP